MLPGIIIKDLGRYKKKINKILNPDNIPYIEVAKNWKLINNKIFEIINELNYDTYYILYEHPVHEFKDKLNKVNKDELIDFINNNFFSPENDGTDVTIATDDFTVIFVCNHDDEIFLARGALGIKNAFG